MPICQNRISRIFLASAVYFFTNGVCFSEAGEYYDAMVKEYQLSHYNIKKKKEIKACKLKLHK